jgi:hypothetical protein
LIGISPYFPVYHLTVVFDRPWNQTLPIVESDLTIVAQSWNQTLIHRSALKYAIEERKTGVLSVLRPPIVESDLTSSWNQTSIIFTNSHSSRRFSPGRQGSNCDFVYRWRSHHLRHIRSILPAGPALDSLDVCDDRLAYLDSRNALCRAVMGCGTPYTAQ